jgi:hypothetical protein
MDKRRGSLFLVNTALFEIVLLVLMSFAIAFILEESLVSAQGGFLPPGSDTPLPDFEGVGGEVIPVKPLLTGPPKTLVPTKSVSAVADAELREAFREGAEIDAADAELREAFREGAEIDAAAVDAQAGAKPYTYDSFFGEIEGFWQVNMYQGLVWAIAAASAVQLIGNLAGLDQDVTNAATAAIAGGIFAGKSAYGLLLELDSFTKTGFVSGAGGLGILIGGGVAFAILAATYKKESKQLVTFQCFPFEAPVGGRNCELCNEDPFRPCSEYRCRSLGQACSFENVGSEEEICIWKNEKDARSPVIRPWIEVLNPRGLSYTPDNAVRPPNRGVKIVSGRENECIQAFTPLEFGVNLDEPARCKIDYNLTGTYEEMEFYVGGNNYLRYNHSQRMKLPGPDNSSAILAPELENDGSFSLFVRCQDANGNENVDAFVFNFCVDPSPDTTPPIVEGASIVDDGFVQFNADEVPIEIYVNEPSECKWSRVSKNYDDMENDMSCDTETFEINAQLNYVCRDDLTGIRNREDNNFFFKCKDQPGKPENDRNVMVQSFELNLKGTQELNILRSGPNETIFGSTDTVPVELSVRTDDGAEEGKSICYFSNTGETDSFVAMFKTDNFEHKQSLDLISGNYEYFFRCIDAGGNTAEDNIAFNVFVDRRAPKVTRAYRDGGLKIVTDEEAECVYSLNNCNYVFDEGLSLVYSNPSIRQNHFVEWKENIVYHIKCKDLRGNEPGPNECNIVVNSVELGGR